MKISPHNLFHTPKDWAELQDWIERHSEPEVKAHLYTVAFMTWNLAADITNNWEDWKEDEGEGEGETESKQEET